MDMSPIIKESDSEEYTNNIAERFRGFLPVVIDVETGGFNSRTDALLEIAAVILEMDAQGNIQIKETHSRNVDPFPGAIVEKAALEFTGIDLYDPERMPEEESEALRDIFRPIRHEISATGCTRSVMVAHNAHFDLGFVNAAVNRNQIKRIRFIPSPVSTPPHSPGSPMVKPYWPRPVRRRIWILIIAVLTAPSMTQ